MKKMKPVSQKLEEWKTCEYQVVLTMAKYGNSQELTCHYYFLDYDEASEWYRKEVSDRCRHQTFIDTTSVVGLYKGKELLRQVKLCSYIN